MKRSKRNQKRQVRLQTYLPFLLMVLGMVTLCYSAKHWFFKYRSLALQHDIVAQYDQQPPEVITTSTVSAQLKQAVTNIYIKGLVKVPVKTHYYQAGTWTIDEDVASYLSQSASPGQPGNIILYGHNKKEILGNIRALKGGETIEITTQDGTKHNYGVTAIHEVRPDQTEFLAPTVEETLTMYTCSGFLDQNRFIVQAKPL